MMKNINLNYCFALCVLILTCINCKEEIELETETFESVLVVETAITNELKQQEIKISRTYLLEESEQIIENNADVRIVDSTGNSFNFSQNTEGLYISDTPFQALPDVEYTLKINTTDGKAYSSDKQALTTVSQINNLYAEYVEDEKKGQGLQIFVDSNNEGTDAEYFRYEYEETYKIVAPFYFSYETVLTNFEEFYVGSYPDYQVFYDVDFVLRAHEEEICYKTNKNSAIILKETTTLNDNVISRNPIRFIDVQDGIIRDRYSILVRQYVQNFNAHAYYSIINSLGNNESILSQNQPGYAVGNIKNIEDDNERVIGFFEVSSMSQQRIFFNYLDYNIAKPEYIFDCVVKVLDFNDNHTIDKSPNQRAAIYNLLTTYELSNYDYHIIQFPDTGGIWKLGKPECTNCTTLGSNIQPDFWID